MSKRSGKVTGRIGSLSGRRLGTVGKSEVRWVDRKSNGVYVGPSVDGTDKEYVKVISGKVNDRKPSFA
ncbi:hypothetical protein E5161_20145 [Cohnella pontilimi]|uniref:Uncharacterized protein n=1 Tax=Cohnella pontilimi TaxID=2564100 RepID=A0A4U0F2W5_9BACL|nr:hypothetical protein [Cohnella pontilimi]TJY38498.1 hypothetical protein E5161_20145 [Cohnella pontilimi]